MYNSRFILPILTLALSGCGGSSSNEEAAPEVLLTGVFIDSAVSGISYSTESQTGVTNANGEFQYRTGENITFSIGELSLPTVPADTTVTPLDMSPTADLNDDIVVNVSRLLQSLDDDGDVNNGITIPAQAAAMTTQLEFNQDSDDFAQNTDVINLVANSGSSNTELVSEVDALNHLSDSVDRIGVVRVTASNIDTLYDKRLYLNANYIIVNADGTFGGNWNNGPIGGTWEMRDDFWCRIITVSDTLTLNTEDCQLWETTGDKVFGARNKGEGVSWVYRVDSETTQDIKSFSTGSELLAAGGIALDGAELESTFPGNKFISLDGTFDWEFLPEGIANSFDLSGVGGDFLDQAWSIVGDELCRARGDQFPCVTVYKLGNEYRLGLGDESDGLEDWGFRPLN